jgi:EAL domain-containing protein (putative c-di-GMP-specific phosphodiesterase class I)
MRPNGLRILLVGTSRSWERAVHAAAAMVGAAAVEVVATGCAAVRRLVTARPGYTHVLAQPGAAGHLLEDLHALTSGEPGAESALVLLGPVRGSPPHVPRIARPNALALSAQLRRGNRRPRAPAARAEGFDVARAIKNCMVRVRYQPIIRVADGACVGLEALARLHHPARGTLAPLRFIRQVENSGLAFQLASKVTARVLSKLAGGALRGRDVTVAINVPLDLLLDPQTMRTLNACCAEAGVAHGQLVLELTERLPVTNLERLRRAVTRLRKAGYGVAIDDLGPWMPNHAALLRMPFSAVKLDIEVVRDWHGAAGGAFLRDALEAARVGGITVIAEGVEDDATWRGLAELGVDQVQGFLISRPLPPAALPPGAAPPPLPGSKKR